MSDTDDTDALLSCDPGGGLQGLLGMTMDDVSSQNDTQSPEKAKSKEPKSSIKGKDGNGSLEISDFFNSDGELVLSGLSQFSETSVSLSESGVVEKSNTDNNEDDKSIKENDDGKSNTQSTSGDDDGKGTPCTVESNTGVSHVILKEKKDESQQKICNKESDRKVEVVKVDKKSVPSEIREDLKNQLVQANRTNPEIQDWLENNSSQISYGVLNLNLNDLKTFAEGLSRCDYFPRKEKVSTFVPTRNERGEQVFTRAPNFRRPGGYRPQPSTRKCRDLTDEQVREEVRRMYAFPDADDEDTDEDKACSKNSKVKEKATDVNKNTEDKVDGGSEDQKPKVQFNFLNDKSITSEFEFGKGKAGKPMKRKLLPYGGGICGGTVGSIPDLGFGLRNIGASLEGAKEPAVERTKTWVTTTTTGPPLSAEDTFNDISRNSEKELKKSGFSFGYGEEEDLLSPIKAVTQSVRMRRSPDKSTRDLSSDLKKVVHLDSGTSSTAPSTSSSDTDVIKLEENKRSTVVSSNTPISLPIPELSSFEKPLTPKRRLIKKAASKLKAMSRYSEAGSRAMAAGVSDAGLSDSVASDLEKILSEIELPAEEIESLIENLDEDDMDLAKSNFFDDIPDEESLPVTFSQLKLDAWRATDSENLAEKFHNEKFKREQCEKELRSLQESFLAEKQHTAVLEGTLKKRNLMLIQITMAFNRICSEWSKFDTENKAAVSKLQKDQKILANACKRSKERISQYEKELHKTLELADSFKSKLTDIQKERDTSVIVLKEANEELEDKIKKLKEDMESLKTERDATLRALRESQIKLDEGKQTLENMESHIKSLEVKDVENMQKYDELLQAKSLQETNYLEVVERRNELEELVMNLTTELNLEKSSKDKLKRDLQEEADRKNRADAERLHDYYNGKVQEILKSATVEASRAEAVLQEQMKRAALESERKLAECKERFQKELEILKARYEAEIEKLKRENLHRQLLISSTVKQLQLGESPNLDVNSLTLQGRGPQLSHHHTKDILDILKGHTSADADHMYKTSLGGSGVSKLTKFTLDHLPSIISGHSQAPGNKGNYNAFHEYVPFETSGNSSRFKTSTPIDAHPSEGSTQNNCQPDNEPGSGDGKRVHNLQFANEESANISEKVCSEKAVFSNNASGSSDSDLKKFVSLLEAPVKPEKEQQISSNAPGIRCEKPKALDPALQICIQDLLKCYAEKARVQENDAKHSDISIRDSFVTFSRNDVPINKNNIKSVSNTDNNNPDDNDVESSEAQSSLQSSTTSECQASHVSHSFDNSKTESRSSKTSKSEPKGQQSTSYLKPPWK